MGGANGAVIPLATVADAWLTRLAALTQAGMPDGATLLGERASLNGFDIPGTVSAGGGCRLYDTAEGTIALNLSRPSDDELLPALFGVDQVARYDLSDLCRERSAQALVTQGRILGLAIATEDEDRDGPAVARRTATTTAPKNRRPRVLDLSALWAGPLAAHLLGLSGADIIKVESPIRPDAMRNGDPGLFALLNQDKANVAIDITRDDGQAALLRLIDQADIVIEAARPRALLQLGVDADAITVARPGLVWITITGHGAEGDAAHWIGLGDDCGVAAGLSARLRAVTGQSGFAGDAIGDPLTGILAALTAGQAHAAGEGGRYILSMRDTVRLAMAESSTLDAELRRWAAARGKPFPSVMPRASGPVAALGEDNARLLAAFAPC